MSNEIEGVSLKEKEYDFELGYSQEAVVILSQKFNDKHIEKFLDLTEEFERLNYKKWIQQRIFRVVVLLVCVGFFIFLTLFLARSFQAIYLEIIKLFLAFLAGFGGGYGLKNWQNGNS